MAFCPNPDCHHRQRTGKPAEYRADQHGCADCGAALVDEPRAEAPAPRRPWPPALLRRLGITVAAMVLVVLLGWLPHPLLDLQVLGELELWRAPTGPFSLGVRPLLVAFVLVELGALAWPRTRERRRRDAALRHRMWLIAAALALGLAWIQGLGLALTLESVAGNGGWGAPLVIRPGWLFRLFTAFMCATGVGLLTMLARSLDRRGLGPGMTALLLVDLLVVTGQGLWMQGRATMMGDITVAGLLAALVGLGICLWGAWRFLERRPRAGLPAALPTTGLFPYELALLATMLPSSLAGLGLMDRAWGERLAPGTNGWLALSLAMVLLGAPLASLLFYWRRRAWWSGPERGTWLRAVALSAGCLAVLVLLEGWALEHLPFLVAAGATGWLSILALLGDARDEIEAWRRPGGEAPTELAVHQDLADALDQLAALQAGDPLGHYRLVGRRFRALTYFFGPYVPLRILGHPSPHSMRESA